MALRQLLLATLLWCVTSSSCPLECTCGLDSRGRNVVECKDGGMVGPLTLANMSLATEVLKISAPETNTNQLTMSPVFNKFKNLEEIYITRSNIPQLGQYFFYGLMKLDILDLSQNNITQPLDHNFRGLSNLKELHLDDNRIYSLPSGTFQYLQELKLLSIQRNRINELAPRIFLEIRKLKVLKLSGNNLNELDPVVFEDVQELKSLECHSCGLQKIDVQLFVRIPHLTHLDLGDNELAYVPSDVFAPLKNLRSLRLDGNRIASIKSSVFNSQHELKRINLARNGITKISRSAFEHLLNLTELDLSHNKLDKLEEELLEPVAGTLEVLMLSGNHLNLHSLKKVLENLEIKELHLAECSMVDLPQRLFPDSVAVLNLAGNYFSALSAEVIPTNVIELDISRNRFRGLDENLLMKLDRLRVFKLDRNPWSCDLCHIIPLLERINKSVAIREITCVQPYTAKGKKLGVLRRNELTWCTVPSYTSSDANYFLLGDDGRIGLIAAGTSVCLLFLTVVAILAAVCYSRRHAAKYYTHEEKLAMDGDAIFDNHSPLFCDDRELSFKFPLDGEKKLSVSTIDEIKKEHAITNGT